MTSSDDWARTERDKYKAVWNMASYGEQNDGEPALTYAARGMGIKAGDSLIDWGCGTGACTRIFKTMGVKATGFDITDNCPTGFEYIIGLLWDPPDILGVFDYSWCTDVLEHIPPEHLDACLDVIKDHTGKAAFIQVDTAPDISGAKMSPPQTLHLSLHSAHWWLNQLKKRFSSVDMTIGLYTRWRYLCRK